MHDSWIDRDEFDELVGAFSKKKKPSKNKGGRRSTPPSGDAVSEESAGEEQQPPNAELVESEKDRFREKVKQKKSGKASRRAGKAKGDKSAKIPKAQKKKKKRAKAKKSPIEPEIEELVPETKVPEPELELPLEVEFENQIALEESQGEALDSIPFLKQDVASEEEPIAEEEPLSEDGILSADPSEVLTTLTVEETSMSEEDLRASMFLGEAADLLESRRRTESERDGDKAVLALAEARKMAERNHLIKDRQPSPNADVELLELLSASETASENEAEREQTATFDFTPEGNLPQRLASFAERADELDVVRQVTVFDRDGYLLHSEKVTGSDNSESGGALLARASGSFCQQSIPGEVSATQVTVGCGEWRCLIAGSGEASGILAEFRLTRPLESREIEVWSKALADAVIPANDLP